MMMIKERGVRSQLDVSSPPPQFTPSGRNQPTSCYCSCSNTHKDDHGVDDANVKGDNGDDVEAVQM